MLQIRIQIKKNMYIKRPKSVFEHRNNVYRFVLNANERSLVELFKKSI